MQRVPPREHDGPVAVRFGLERRVVDAVHAWCDDDRGERAVERRRQPPVAVVERGRGLEHHLEDQHERDRRSDRRHLRGAPRARERELAGVEAQRRRHVEIEIGVVHEVKAPEHRHAMVEAMPDVHRVVEQQQPGHPGNERRRRQPVQETEAAALRRAGDREADGHDRQTHDKGGAERERRIHRQALAAWPDARAQWRARLGHEQHRQHEPRPGADDKIEPHHDTARSTRERRRPRACTIVS